MISLQLPGEPSRPLTILCLGAHSDDIEIGCGGAILKLAQQHPGSRLQWVVFSANEARETEARYAARLFGGTDAMQMAQVQHFRDGFLPFVAGEVKAIFEDLKQSIEPDLIFTHFRNDAHQDHRILGELTWNTFRDHLILEYEIPKYDGDLGQPNVFVPLQKEHYEQKVQYLLEAFPSQRAKRWFEESTFLSLMRLRGMECNAPSGYAEAFYCRKVVL